MNFFKNIKLKIIDKIKRVLGIIDLEKELVQYELTNCEKHINTLQYIKSTRTELFKINDKLSETNEKLNALKKTVSSIISIGADITRHEHDTSGSWAVICVEGKYNIVKFINMKGQDYVRIVNFLREFECSRRVIDAPPYMMFEDNFVWKSDDK
jgi:hypothetical protein